jgi:hypothetical protein
VIFPWSHGSSLNLRKGLIYANRTTQPPTKSCKQPEPYLIRRTAGNTGVRESPGLLEGREVRGDLNRTGTRLIPRGGTYIQVIASEGLLMRFSKLAKGINQSFR